MVAVGEGGMFIMPNNSMVVFVAVVRGSSVPMPDMSIAAIVTVGSGTVVMSDMSITGMAVVGEGSSVVEVGTVVDVVATEGMAVFSSVGLWATGDRRVGVTPYFLVKIDIGGGAEAGLPHPAINNATDRVSSLNKRVENIDIPPKPIMEIP